MHELIAAVGYVPRQNVLRNQRACADVGACSDVNPAYDQGAPANERAVFDDGRRFFGGRIVPGDRWVKLAVDKVPCDPAALSYPGMVTDVALDHRVVAYF